MSEKKHNLELDVQYPDTRLEAEITPDMVERWVRASLLGPAELQHLRHERERLQFAVLV